jgi:DNA processing protein
VSNVSDILDVLSENSSERVYLAEGTNEEQANMIYDTNINYEVISDVRNLIIEKLNYDPTSIDDIVSITEYSYSTIMMAVVELELTGKLIRHPGNKISLLFGDLR